MTQLPWKGQTLSGPGGSLEVRAEDEVARKLLMLAEGECWGLGPLQAAQKYGYSKQRYFQLRGVYEQGGSAALESEKRGPKRNYRRTDEVVRQVIRYRFLDPESSPEVIAQKLVQSGWTISIRSVTRVLADYGLQKKLHRFRPRAEGGSVEARITQKVVRQVDRDPQSIENGVRQRLADKISDSMAGLWLLVPEHLRLGTWDLLRAWSRQATEQIEPRLALQLLHEAALCTNGLREGRCLTLRGFETLNGLPFLAGDKAIHELLGGRSVADAEELQVALGKLRRTFGHYAGKLLLIDPHRAPSYSQRHMRRRQKDRESKAVKTAQMFFCLDGDTSQPVCFTSANSARTVSQATPELLRMAGEIPAPLPEHPLVAADTEHFAVDLLDHVHGDTPFDLITPMPNRQGNLKRWREIPPETFQRHWAGYATAVLPYTPYQSQGGPYHELVQRHGERPEESYFTAFLSTTDRDPVDALTRDFPKRWHIEEFFNFNQSLGWRRAGTMNINIRYGQMTMALVAQALIHQFRKRLGDPFATWDARSVASNIFRGLDGDIRVVDDTILVTYYNAPNRERLREQYEDLPAKLRNEKVDPKIPWLYGFQLDFRFR
ncbi:MAG: helix-turn-helix domain-containing protein [Thermoguttaceae bacterium]